MKKEMVFVKRIICTTNIIVNADEFDILNLMVQEDKVTVRSM